MAWEWSTREDVRYQVHDIVYIHSVRAIAVGDHKRSGHRAATEDNRDRSHNVVDVDLARSIDVAVEKYNIRWQYPFLAPESG